MSIFDKIIKKEKKKEHKTARNLPKGYHEVDTIPLVEDYVAERAKKLRAINYKFAQVFEPKQNLLIWFNGKESKIIGYPKGLRVDLDDYVILYQVRPPSWIDSVVYSLLRIFGKQPPLAVIRAPKEIVKLGDESITILAHAFIINEYQEYEAVPLSHDIVDAKLYLALKKENDMLWDLIAILRHRVPEVVEDAMKMNPRIKTYMSTKTKDQVEGTQEEKFGGVEVEFTDPFSRFRGIKHEL